MRFLVDAQLPPALARALASAGHQAEHLEDVDLRQAKDSIIWNYAQSHEATLITKDEDFVDHYRRHPDGPAIIWIRLGNVSRQKLLTWFMPLVPQLLERLQTGDKLIEVR